MEVKRLDNQLIYKDFAERLKRKARCCVTTFGCVIVNENGEIIGEGWNGPPENEPSCKDLGGCQRTIVYNPETNQKCYRGCRAVHAEVRAILNALKVKSDLSNCILYLVGDENYHSRFPCEECRKIIREVKIKKVVWW
jgi:deoxycytidylate deaminase